MKRYSVKTIICIFVTLFSIPTFAENIINVTVKTSEQSAVAIGFSVVGKSSGGLGSRYSGKGPKNQRYSFGYRKKINGSDIHCGDITLAKDTTVTIVTKNDRCFTVVSE